MFDIGLLELSLVMLVGLMVLGPARLPEVVRSLTKASRWLKKIITSTKKEMSENIGLDEIYQDLHNEEILEREKRNADQSQKESN
jgi:sec-independent protein translocase protein TatB|tara:strand:- start:299 stop:553 length:255 start_codon:yes stop_codon:yes gene_type:complete